jgi:hypothetical protein
MWSVIRKGLLPLIRDMHGHLITGNCEHFMMLPALAEKLLISLPLYTRWMLSKGLPKDQYFKTNDPSPPIQILKLFAESFIILRKGPLPSQHTVIYTLSCFMSEWERITSKRVPKIYKNNVYNVQSRPFFNPLKDLTN